jgi:coenzyme F420-reducing hydrogenase gamma subunit
MLGMEPRQIYHLTYAAAEAGLSLDTGQLSVEGEWETASDVLLSVGFNPGETRSTSPTGPSLRESASSKRFVLDEEACTGCGDCAEQCPTRAVVMEDGRPVQEQERCVACFACMEICQPRAITLEPLCPTD